MGSSAPSSVWISLVASTHLNYPYAAASESTTTLHSRTHGVDDDESHVLTHALKNQSPHVDDDDDRRVAQAK